MTLVLCWTRANGCVSAQVYAGVKVAAEAGLIKEKDMELWNGVEAWLVDRRL